MQVQYGPGANSNKGDGITTGWTRISVPNYWGQYTHGDLGYGRCHEPYYANDKFAVDYPMDRKARSGRLSNVGAWPSPGAKRPT